MIYCESCGKPSTKAHGEDQIDNLLCAVCWAKARWSDYIAMGNPMISFSAFLAKERIYGVWILDKGFPINPRFVANMN